MWIDVHCHLDYFQNPELAVEEAVSVGVEKIIANSTTLEGLHKVLALQKQFPENVKAALGYHPTHFIEDSKQKIEETFNHVIQHAPECIAFGEIGLDFEDSAADLDWAVNSFLMSSDSTFEVYANGGLAIVEQVAEMTLGFKTDFSFEHDGKRQHTLSNKTHFAAETTEN